MLPYLIVLALLAGLYALLIRKLGRAEGLDAASTIATTLATVVLSVFTYQQLSQANRQQEIERTARWGELRNAMWEIMDQYPPTGVAGLKALPADQRVQWLRTMRKLLDGQIGNAVLISDRVSLGHWRNAISSVKTTTDVLVADPAIEPQMFERTSTTVLKDITAVWQRLVLDSNEVSATGGRP